MNYLIIVIKLVIIGSAVAMAFVRKRPIAMPQWLRRFVRRQNLTVAAVALLAFAVSAANTALNLRPPFVHDEFSNLLQADTFAAGRLTNPTHPMWEHFESFHIIQQPTYASKYPPARGALHALGIVLGGHPIVGSWVAMALAAGACCWMFYGWVPPRWAAAGGLIVALHPSIHTEWAQAYMGGLVGLAGGAMIYGALPRLVRHPCWTTSVLMACGVMLLANGRPYEGLVSSLPVATALLFQIGKRIKSHWRQDLAQIVLPSLVVFTAIGSWMAYYNHTVTGRWTTMPYQVYEETYGLYKNFVWSTPREVPSYRHPVIRAFYTQWVAHKYDSQQTFAGFLAYKTARFSNAFDFYLGKLLLIPLLFSLPTVWSRKWMPFLALSLGVGLAGSSIVVWLNPRYLAPVMPIVFLFVVQGLRRLRQFGGRRSAFGQMLVLVIVAIHSIDTVEAAATFANPQRDHWSYRRASIDTKLQADPMSHVVIVSYAKNHNVLKEWVYNRADIDAAKVVWARDMGPEKNRELIDYFKDRRIWRLYADDEPPRLVPYHDDSPKQ